ncbi:metalloendoproteinase 1 [Phtheirospermum japonicum]|uniref:Metalloendoproteinase 1 n=1 Tax=Phtheirospermum japonicum TaxID=374723 RepID=A0A830CTB4_9LAMI|nr:metalloendoproteinase 1 [Phtheirospermum japonicum]
MESKYFHLLSSIFLILLLNPFPVVLTLSEHDSKIPSSPLDFLNNMIGSRKGNSTKGLSQLKKYLSKLGYVSYHNDKHENDDLFDDNLELAIKLYQKFFKLKVNGVLDDNTVNKMKQPRCGVPDFFAHDKKAEFENLVHSKYTFFPGKISIGASHYTFFSGAPKWPPEKRNLTYSFPPGERTDVNASTLDATDMWASVSDFRFSYIEDYNQADIKISFQRGAHGDEAPFDGRGGVLAHAFSPPDGTLHYDADEDWVYDTVKDEFDVLTVGLHELGHVLGLGHSSDDGAIMWPYIGSGERKGLGKDDKNGIRALYS